ncbi:MAG: phosphoheptose isomerase, partial [Muribaculaceae bacterium]|nr:phosphoheptose isomerase [Muribaculaceae bacterium]
MSFMYNPFPYDDPRPVNRPNIPVEAVDAVVSGSLNCAKALAAQLEEAMKAAPGKNMVVAMDGYTTSDWSELINLLSQQLTGKGIELDQINYQDNLKSEEEINAMIDPMLEWDREKDPTLLYGKIFRGGYEALLDENKIEAFRAGLRDLRAAKADKPKVVVVYGSGCMIPANRDLYDMSLYFDVTPKESILRIRRGQYVNLGQKEARPANQIIRRCYYADFEMAVHLRRELLRDGVVTYYVPSDKVNNLQLIPVDALKKIFASMASYPFRCKPVYLEGVWGGSYVRKLRNLPAEMRNCAWVFDLIPMEVSIVVEAGKNLIEFPYSTFFMTASEAVMGDKCASKFGGYFPIRFNYDDSYHSTGNMSIQCHSDAAYNKENFDELGRQDESYYVVVTGHNAKTFVGFRDDADIDQFIKEIKIADKEYKPVDYMK